MPKFSLGSFTKLSTVHPELQLLFLEIIKYIDCTVIEGHRGEAEQNLAFKEGTSKLQWPNGKHNSIPSLAIDVSPYPIIWGNLKRFYLFAGYVLSTAQQLKNNGTMKHAIRWGGNFSGDGNLDEGGLIDLPHYELIM